MTNHIKLFEAFVGDNRLKSFFRYFTENHRNSNNRRFLPLQDERDLVCNYLEEQKPNNFEIYRATYQDYGNIGRASKGQEVYEPLMSCSSSRSVCEDMLKSWGDNDRISSKGKGPQLMLIVFEKGTKTADVDDISAFTGQKEHITGGKFKITNKRNYTLDYTNYANEKHSLDILEVTVKQIFNESFIDCFDKMSAVKTLPTPASNNSATSNNENVEALVLNYYEKSKKKTLQGAEITRIEKKGIKIDDTYLTNLLSKRIYNSCSTYVKNLTYQEFLDIMKKNNCKIYGGKKFGYPELEFADKITESNVMLFDDFVVLENK